MARGDALVTFATRRGWRKWVAVALSLVILGLLGGSLGKKLGDVEKNNADSFLPPSAESTKAIHIAQDLFGNKNQLGLTIVFAHDGGLTEADKSAIQSDAQAIAPYVLGGRSTVVPSADGAAALLTAQMAIDEHKATEFTNNMKKLRTAVHAKANQPAGLQVYVSGDAGSTNDFFDAFSGLDGALLFSALGIVALLLFFTYRSPVLWLVPLIAAGGASQAAQGVVYLLAKSDIITVNGQSAAILPILAIGVGTDYALLLISRYREELHAYADRHDAMAVAVRRTLPAILASAATVALAMLVLLLSQLNSNKGLGPVLAIGVAVVFLSMIFFLPAVLVCLGRWVFWPFIPHFDSKVEAPTRHPVWSRISGFVARNARMVWLVTAAGLSVGAFGLTQLHVGLPQSQAFTKKTESISGLSVLAQHYPAGSSQPLDIYAAPETAAAVAGAAAAVANVSSVGQPQVAGSWAHLPVGLAVPSDSHAADVAVDQLRAAVHAVPGSHALVGGGTAINLDASRSETHDRNLVIPVTLVLIFLILSLLLRALLAPLLLLGTVVLSFLSILGLATLLFHAVGHPSVNQGFFLSSFIFLVALGVDYTIFLMTRAREEIIAGGVHVAGVQRAVTVTGGVITSAGLVLAGTFAVLGVLPIVFLLQIGIAVAFGVLLDTFVVRTLLVPALAIDTGRRFWWPSALSRVVDAPAAIVPPARGAPEERVSAG
ncbi:MAG: putative drug exporter of the superfamily [Frankiaceae bacterium]|nr:putative drug exporter of the superfamily [Frankiaceae bacterium]